MTRAKPTLVYENHDQPLSQTLVQKQEYRTLPTIYVNTRRISPQLCSLARPNQTLLSFLRNVLQLTGTKLGCAEGGCGACTVLVSRWDDTEQKIIHSSVNACLMPVLAVDGCHVTTVEGVGSVRGGDKGEGLHPVQKAMVHMHGSQCGFCTPGIIVAIYSLLANNSSKSYMEEHLDGNLCRCTGYRSIWDAARSVCTDIESTPPIGPCGTSCRDCPERDTCEMDCNENDKQQEEKKQICEDVAGICCSTTHDVLFKAKLTNTMDEPWRNKPNLDFPEELMSSSEKNGLIVVDPTYHKAGTWIKPQSLEELLDFLHRFQGECKIVVGNTEVGIETKFKHSVFPRLIYPSHTITSLYSIQKSSTHLQIGSCTPLSTLQSFCHELIESPDDTKYHGIAKPIHDMLRWFASTQIRNVACLGGNLATASPISDMNPLLASLNATLVICSSVDGGITIQRRTCPVTDFFKSYRTVDLKPNELIEGIKVPVLEPVFEYAFPFKQARRREDDISIVTSGMRIKVFPKEAGYVIDEVQLAFGGMAPKTIVAMNVEKALLGKTVTKDNFTNAMQVLRLEMDLPDDVPGGQAQFRKTLACSFIYKLFLKTSKAIKDDIAKIENNPNLVVVGVPKIPAPDIDDSEQSGLETFVEQEKPSIAGKQIYPEPKVACGLETKMGMKSLNNSNPSLAERALGGNKEVGKAAPHASGALHCTGEAIYTDDIPLPPGALHACLVQAKTCNVTFESISTDEAMSIPGVVAVYTHEDIAKLGGDNLLGPIMHDEFVFLPKGEIIHFVGQVIGVCIAKTLEIAEIGTRSIKIEYGDTNGQPIVSIEDAIEAESYYSFAKHSMDRIIPMEVCDEDQIVTVSGSFRCGGQEHFYLETNSTLAVPSEGGTNLKVYTSTQAVTKTQMYCASSTNTPSSKVVVCMKRMGGGFGGKETRNVFSSCAASVAAKISNRPVRLTLGRDIDMSITGGRHAFLAKYEASAIIRKSKEVKLKCLKVQLFNNAGSAFDLSGPVLDRALFHIDNSYFWPELHSVGIPCKTVQPPHTAFRGFGGPQGLATCEHIIDHLADVCQVSGDQLRRDNLYSSGQSTPFGMILGENFAGQWNIPTMWDKLYNELKIPERRSIVNKFNQKNKWVKRGIAITPTKFGIAFTAKFMNQGGALVHVYTDGTVLVSHGGTEMGQGLHTKICQIAAQAFGIPLEDVFVNDTSSDKVANTIPTAASMSTDMYGMAALDACNQIIQRIKPVKDKLPKGASLKEIASAAFYDRVDLSAHGFFALDDDRCGYEWEKEKPANFPDDSPENSWKGHPFNYFTQGVACSEVEIDVLTGNHSTIRSDVLVDVGSSINPALDIGQIEGAFIQGLGWSTLEEVVYGDDDHTWVRPGGKTFTSGPGTYKIPAFNDVPGTLNVTLMENVNNPFAVHSSKAIGEPPFFLGCSVFYAIKDAVKAARSDAYPDDNNFEFFMPATSERIRMSCGDMISVESIPSTKETNLSSEEKLAKAKSFQPKMSC